MERGDRETGRKTRRTRLKGQRLRERRDSGGAWAGAIGPWRMPRREAPESPLTPRSQVLTFSYVFSSSFSASPRLRVKSHAASPRWTPSPRLRVKITSCLISASRRQEPHDELHRYRLPPAEAAAAPHPLFREPDQIGRASCRERV